MTATRRRSDFLIFCAARFRRAAPHSLKGYFMNYFDVTLQKIQDAFENSLLSRPIDIPAQGFLTCGGTPLQAPRLFERPGFDNHHFPLDFCLVLSHGLTGIINRARKEREGLTLEAAAMRAAIAHTYEAVTAHVLRHSEKAWEMAQKNPEDAKRLERIAQNLDQLAHSAPETFEQGIQLFYLIWRIRGPYPSTIGRLDVYLSDLYKKDVPARVTRDEALCLLCELWEKLNDGQSGDTLMNLMLGGVDEQGRDVSTDLSILMMEATMRVRKSEPHINIRLHAHTPKAFWETACRMIAMGQGQGVAYFDENIIPPLIARGYAAQDARRYANDGCTEITFDGLAPIHFWQMEMVKTLELTLFGGRENPCAPFTPVHKWHRQRPEQVFKTQLQLGHMSGDVAAMRSYQDVYNAFLDQLHFQVEAFLHKIKAEKDRLMSGEVISELLMAGTVAHTLDTGIDPLRGGYPQTNFQLLSGSIPTVADALCAIREVVFKKRECTMQALLQALETDFKEQEPLRQMLLAAPKFGNDDDRVDLIAADIARRFIAQVEAFSHKTDIRILPGLYNIDFNLFAASLGATPDGRHAGDLICEHFSPTPGRAKLGPTAILQSAAKAPLQQGCAASPVYLALPAQTGGTQTEAVEALLKGAEKLGLPILSIAIYDRAILEDAVLHPKRHQDLIVRVWGFNARFVDLDASLQKHIIARVLK